VLCTGTEMMLAEVSVLFFTVPVPYFMGSLSSQQLFNVPVACKPKKLFFFLSPRRQIGQPGSQQAGRTLHRHGHVQHCLHQATKVMANLIN
jgi:hypothetical protein